MIRIAIDARSLQEATHTGVSNYAKRVLSSLADNTSCTIKGVSISKKQVQISANTDRFSHVHISRSSRIHMLQLLTKRNSAFIKELNTEDIIWLPNIAIIQNLSKPYILTVHDLSFVRHPYFYGRKEQLWHRVSRMSNLLSNASGIICVSESTRQELFHFYPDLRSKPIKVIHLAANSPISENRIHPKEYLLYVGTIEPRKNIETLLAAYSDIRKNNPELDLVIAGKKGWRAERLVSLIQSLPGVSWYNYVDESMLHALYEHARALIWPSLYEGFGLPPLESLAHRTPVIVSDRTSLPEILKQNAVYVNPYNTNDILAAVQQVLSSGSSTHEMPLRTWNDVAKEHLDFFKTYENRN